MLVTCQRFGDLFYLGWSGSILQFRQNIIKVGPKSWLLTCSSKITLSIPSLKRELNFCNLVCCIFAHVIIHKVCCVINAPLFPNQILTYDDEIVLYRSITFFSGVYLFMVLYVCTKFGMQILIYESSLRSERKWDLLDTWNLFFGQKSLIK